MDCLYSVTSGVDGSFVYVSILYVPSSFLSACVYVAMLCLESALYTCMFVRGRERHTFLNCALPDLLLPTLHSHGRLDAQTDEVYTFDIDFQRLAFDSGYKFMSLSTEESDISHRGACSWEPALFKGPDDFNGCGYFHIILLLIALRHI